MKGEAKDIIELWYIQGSEESQSIRITVPAE